MVDNYLGNDTYLMSSQSDHEETQDETSSQGDFQQRNEDWDDIFRGKGQSSATSDLFGQVRQIQYRKKHQHTSLHLENVNLMRSTIKR